MRTKLQNLNARLQEMIATPGFKRYFFNTGWMFAEKVLRLIAGLFIGAYVARYLGPSRYGLLNYVLSLVSLVAVLATLGLDYIVIRELVKDEKKRDVILGTSFLLRMIGAVVVFIILIIITESTSTDALTKTLVYIVACGTFFEVFGVIDHFFQSKVWSKYVVWSQMIALAAVSIFRVTLIFAEAELQWFAWSYVLDFFILAIGLVYFYGRNSFSLFTWKFDTRIAIALLKDSWPLIFASLAVTIYMKIDQVMIKWMLGNEANGNYGVAVRLSEMWNFIPMAICGSLFPAILNAKTVGEGLYLQRLQSLFDLMVAISVGIAIPMTFLSGFVVRLLFGEAYSDAGNILAIYVWSGVFTFLGVANGKWVVTENLQIFRMTTLVIAGILNIVLNYFLIHSMGLYGAAVATLVAYSFAGYFCFLLLEKTRPIFISMSRSFNLFRLYNLLNK